MPQIQYSPFLYQNQEQTNQKQTTSYKKYPTNKYYDSLNQDNDDDIKQKLFIQQKKSDPFFINDRVNKMIKINSDYNDTQNFHPQQFSENNYLSFKPLIKKNFKNSKENRKIQRVKSCTMQKVKPKKSVNSKLKKIDQQKQQQLLMYKQLCLSLRKQNQTLQNRLQKQQKRQNKFSTQISALKNKIKKLYDHCIEKNKSSKNVDYSLKQIIKSHLVDKNSTKNDKENQSLIFNSKSEFKNKLKAKLEGKSNQQTIDTTTRTSRPDLNTSSAVLKGSKSYDKKRNKKQVSNTLSRIFHQNSQRLSNNYKMIPSQFPKYDISELPDNYGQTIESSARPSSSKIQDNIYKQFFSTFVKSLEIFQNESTKEHKSKNKLLKDGGYYVQWAKQQWLQIVEYLIKKGYVLGSSKNNKQKLYDSSFINQKRQMR